MRILIADDSLLSRRLLEETLIGWGYQVSAVPDGAEAWRILSGEDPPALAILDWMMPGFTGPELCRMVRESGKEPYTYILLLTSRSERDDLVQGMNAGADDYVIKPFDRHELRVRLRAGTRIVDLQEQLVATREALRQQATRDYLTEVWNRSAILGILDRELARSEREGTPVGVVVVDLDHFKTVNDTYGHMAGDTALRHATARMQACIRPYDSLGRYGGEEFVIVLPGADERTVRSQAERMRAAIRDTPVELAEKRITISASLGCTAGTGGDATAEMLIRTADTALYQAKRAGRDRVDFLRCAGVSAGAVALA
jgi:two-component system, cell cycle response regulator